MHGNCNITYAEDQALLLLGNILSMAPKASGGEGKSREDVIGTSWFRGCFDFSGVVVVLEFGQRQSGISGWIGLLRGARRADARRLTELRTRLTGLRSPPATGWHRWSR